MSLPHLLTYTRDVVLRHQILSTFGRSVDDRRLHVDCRLPWNRYFYLTLRFLSEIDTGISVRATRPHIVGPATYARFMNKYAKLAFTLPGVRFTAHPPRRREEKIGVVDGDAGLGASGGDWGRRIRLRSDISATRPSGSDWLMAPYPMHPLRYHAGDDRRLETLRRASRNVRLMFAGNVDRAAYRSEHMLQLCARFGYATRPDLFDALIRAAGRVDYLAADEHLGAILRGDSSHELLVSTADKYAVPQRVWMDFLARADFFVALPGVSMPMCHNAIEAMAVGTIPIVAHTDWFHPPLVHGRDCLSPNGPEGMRDVLHEATAMSGSRLDQMKQNVIDYYERHLSPSAFVQRLLAHPSDPLTVYFNFEDTSELARTVPSSLALSEQRSYAGAGAP
ncbi:MAG: glycosyltransferase [Vicinamibacterales bacterium]